MFSALKRLVAKDGENKADIPQFNVARGGVQPMNHSLQRKFARGIQYNSKSTLYCFMKFTMGLLYSSSENNH